MLDSVHFNNSTQFQSSMHLALVVGVLALAAGAAFGVFMDCIRTL